MDWAVEPIGESPRQQAFEQGSYLHIAAAEIGQAGTITGLDFELFLTRNEGPRTIAACDAFHLGLENQVVSLVRDGVTLIDSVPVPSQIWLSVVLRQEGQGLSLSIRGHDPLAPFTYHHHVADVAWRAPSGDLRLGSSGAADARTLNAKFARLTLATPQPPVAWIFPTLLPDGPILSTNGLKLDSVNLPAFCITSPRWDGSSFEPRLVPSHYDAVHCHDDDMARLAWPASYRLSVPADAAPGIYAFDVDYEGGSEEIVFFVTSSAPQAPIVFLVPTATYLAYADEYLPRHLYEWKCDDRGHAFAVANNLRSLYDYHGDRSGVSICSWRKPKATLRSDYLYPLCGAPHNLPVDLHLLRFCHANGIAFDLITDFDLDRHGIEALRNYRTVVTGSHPEYISVRMESALRRFAAEGGSLAYLGGNGFAGTVAFRDDLLELRRGPTEAGRTWDGKLAEQSLALTNEPGGYLRSRGRGEFSLIGGAISLMGFDGARPFTRTPESHSDECAWLFEGVENDTFGDEGIVLGGAAGYEIDATDPHLGTAPGTIVVARADGFPESFFHDPTRWYEGGEAEMRGRRVAEMTLRFLSKSGLIFSASSVAWCGALPEPGGMNDVGRITLNLLQFLSQPKPE
ncbi:N,N-dimethylformamidase beta subunit family domain-containing protein [Nordella sp. HKS 07]|uniref:N,N-dimethylformamidase beta subunit family domain-containing protein n=1 Tax=Nordella sp. HKS 07 TaxID=2712222 RepID=UPI001FEECA2B|nr:N,N-dimethylformamidase beta subunit family domain-containing protein [Nordella sp. HKS 07]